MDLVCLQCYCRSRLLLASIYYTTYILVFDGLDGPGMPTMCIIALGYSWPAPRTQSSPPTVQAGQSQSTQPFPPLLT